MGHYFAFAKNDEDKLWYEFNDDKPSKTLSEKEVRIKISLKKKFFSEFIHRL